MENLRIKANGVELEVNHYPNNGETIVFLHFSGGCLAQWNGIIPNFMEKYNIVTLDLRGHGKSEKAGSGYTLDNMGKDIIEVMNQLGIDKTHLVGSSLGGEIAVSLAANYSHRIKSVVAEGAIQNYFGENGVCDIPVEEIPHKKIELRTAREKKIMPIFHSLQEKIEFSKQNFMEGGILWNKQLEEFETYNSTETVDGNYTTACPKWVIDMYLEDFWDIKFEKYFEKINCPVLMLPSEEEWASEEVKSTVEKLQSLLKISKVEVISGGYHAYVAFQYPDEFSKVIQEFYNEIDK